jgi:formate hydrogenlyase transcriptional activator
MSSSQTKYRCLVDPPSNWAPVLVFGLMMMYCVSQNQTIYLGLLFGLTKTEIRALVAVSSVFEFEPSLRSQLEDRLRFETFISDLSARFVRLPSSKVNHEVDQALREVTEFFHAHRCGLLEVSGDLKMARLTHVWYAQGVRRVPPHTNCAEGHPWSFDRLVKQKQAISFNDLSDLPPDAEPDLPAYEAGGVRSSLMIPLFTEEAVRHIVVMQTMAGGGALAKKYIPRLQLLGEILVNALGRKKADDALRESEARLNLAAASAQATLWTVEAENGHIWCTDQGRELLGLTPSEEITFDRFLQVVYAEDRSQIREIVAQAYLTGKEVRGECRIVLSGGNIRWIALRGRAQYTSSGKPLRLMGCSVDISERKRADEELRLALAKVRQLRDQLQHENMHLRQEVKQLSGRSRIVGQSAAIRGALALVEQVAPTPSTVLLLGETGTGKELFASAIHELSSRKSRLMIRMNCAAIPAPLIESELFGREKGAYTGAISKQIGRFEMAHGSTLFLDEIGELPMDIQVKLLRVLQEKSIERLGNPRPIPVDVRIIAATNKDLEKGVQDGKFREDLYYRLNVFPITVPPLRDRREDIPLLTWSFLEEFATTLGKHVDAIPQSAMDMLVRYSWPGNIRELRNVIERAMILATDSQLRVQVPNGINARSLQIFALEDVERKHFLSILDMTGWRVRGKNGAAEILGLKPTTLVSRLTKLGIKRPA